MSVAVHRLAPSLLLAGCVLIVGPPIGDTNDTIDTSDTSDTSDTGDTSDTAACPQGTVSFTPDGGSAGDLTAVFAVGTAASPAAYTITVPGTLAFCPGTYFAGITVTAAEAVVVGAGAEFTVLSGGGTTRIVHHQGAESIALTGLTLTLGSATDGGAVLADVGEIETTDCVFLENAATNRGGALAALVGEIDAADTVFDDNEGGAFGGAIWVASDLTLTDVVLKDNESTAGPGVGGAVYSQGATTTITRTTFQDNASTNVGGGLYAGGTVTIASSTFAGNASTGVYGGGMALVSATATLTDTVFEGNIGFDEGGAAHFSGSDVTCVRTAEARGGFYSNNPGVMFIDLGDDTLTSDRCDWGETTEDNLVYDLATVNTGGTATNHTFGDDESFSCDATTCTPAR